MTNDDVEFSENELACRKNISCFLGGYYEVSGLKASSVFAWGKMTTWARSWV